MEKRRGALACWRRRIDRRWARGLEEVGGGSRTAGEGGSLEFATRGTRENHWLGARSSNHRDQYTTEKKWPNKSAICGVSGC